MVKVQSKVRFPLHACPGLHVVWLLQACSGKKRSYLLLCFPYLSDNNRWCGIPKTIVSLVSPWVSMSSVVCMMCTNCWMQIFAHMKQPISFSLCGGILLLTSMWLVPTSPAEEFGDEIPSCLSLKQCMCLKHMAFTSLALFVMELGVILVYWNVFVTNQGDLGPTLTVKQELEMFQQASSTHTPEE